MLLKAGLTNNMKKQHLKNFASGAAKTLHGIGTTVIKGASAGVGYAAKKATGSNLIANASKNNISRGNAVAEKKWGAGSRTKMGFLGGVAATSIMPTGRAIGAFTKGVKVAKAAKATFAKRSLAGKKAAETYRSKLPRTPDTVEYKSTPIYPTRNRPTRSKK